MHRRVAMLVIVHRLTIVEGCDMLDWLDKGCVRCMGTV